MQGVQSTDLDGLRLKLWFGRAFSLTRDNATNNVGESALRPSVIQRTVTNGYRAKWFAVADADLRATVDTARRLGANPSLAPPPHHPPI